MVTKHELHERAKTNTMCPFIIHSHTNCGNIIPNWHSNIEIICTLQGEVLLQYDDETLKMAAGELSVINSNILHRISMGENKKYHCIIIDNQFCKENGFDTDKVVFDKIFTSAVTYELCERVVKCYDEYRRAQTDINVAKLRSSVLLLLIDIFENHRILSAYIEKTKSKTSEQYVKNAISYLTDNYREKITLDNLAELCGITKCHLSREFKKYTGQTVMTYLNLLRCKNAQKIIKDGSSITEAAMNVGFDDLSYFSKTYKSLLGVSPTKDKNE